MRTIFNTIAAVVVCITGVIAQTPPPKEVGFIRFVNAVAPGTGSTRFLVNGENFYPKGYSLGDYTGGFGLKAGSHSISVSRQGVKDGITKIHIAAGETLTLIGFAERAPSEKEGNPPVWESRILRLKQSDPGNGYNVSFISVCDKEEISVQTLTDGQTSPRVHTVGRLRTSTIRIGGTRTEIGISVDGKPVTTVSPDSPGNYVVLLYQDAEGAIKALSFFDPKFVIAG